MEARFLILLIVTAITIKSHAEPTMSESSTIESSMSEASTEVTTPPEEPCSRIGPMCKDCRNQGVCVNNTGSIPGYHFDPTKNVPCITDWYCDEVTLQCARDGICRYKEFKCPNNTYETEEVFPDPYSCVKYHGCEGTDQYDYVCLNGKGFDPMNRNCSLELNNELCSEYLILCLKSGQSGQIGKSAYSYVCKEDTGPPHVIYPVITLKTN